MLLTYSIFVLVGLALASPCKRRFVKPGISESDGRRPRSYESSEAGLRQDSCAGGEVGGEAASGRACGWGGWEA
eukprot:3917682-Pleurochrysis_carterae.AAC.1